MSCIKIGKTLGQGKKEILRKAGFPLFLVSSRFPRKALSFLITVEDAMDSKCKRCPDFIHKQDNASMLEEAFGQSGIWDFKTCHSTCWREKDRQNMYMSNRYRYSVGLGVGK